MKITRQEDTLSEKLAFERWAAKFGVRIKINHADNGRYSEQPFISAIDDSNQTITPFGVGSHHQNSIVERKNQTLTLGSRTLLLNEKIYWPEAITKMLWTYELKYFA